MSQSHPDRRGEIRDALRACVIEKGYAATTLADIARAARMSPSHLLYYYKGKDAILADFFESISESILTTLASFNAMGPEAKIDAFAEYVLGRQDIEKSELGMMLEIFGIAVHQKELHRTKTQLDRAFKDWLVELFAAVQRPGGLTAEYCAQGTYALVLGLLPAAFFDERMSVSQTHCILRDAMRRWAGLDGL